MRKSKHYLPDGRIKTPRGRVMTYRQYLALHVAQSMRSEGDSPPCEHGHYDCACWDRGPCSNEVASFLPVDEEDDL